jgi:hypothetical protein
MSSNVMANPIEALTATGVVSDPINGIKASMTITLINTGTNFSAYKFAIL